MNKVIFIAAILSLSLSGCEFPTFDKHEQKVESPVNALDNSEEAQAARKAEKEAFEKIEGKNITKYPLDTSDTKGVYSACILGYKNYVTLSEYDYNFIPALDINEDHIPCNQEGNFQLIFSSISGGLRFYCSQETVLYALTSKQYSYQFFPMRSKSMQLIPCERK